MGVWVANAAPSMGDRDLSFEIKEFATLKEVIQPVVQYQASYPHDQRRKLLSFVNPIENDMLVNASIVQHIDGLTGLRCVKKKKRG